MINHCLHAGKRYHPGSYMSCCRNCEHSDCVLNFRGHAPFRVTHLLMTEWLHYMHNIEHLPSWMACGTRQFPKSRSRVMREYKSVKNVRKEKRR